MSYKEFIIFRLKYDKEGTPGEFRESGRKLFSTLERPENKNKKDDPKTQKNESSCIPEGRYFCRPYSSERYKKTWEIKGVKARDKILYHAANCIDDLRGCVGIGRKFANNVKHPLTSAIYKHWLMSSKSAFEEFCKVMPQDGFYVTITSQRTEDACRLSSNNEKL